MQVTTPHNNPYSPAVKAPTPIKCPPCDSLCTINFIPHSIQQSSSEEADSHSAGQEIVCLLRSPKVCYSTPAIRSCPEPDESSPYPQIPCNSVLLSHLCLGLSHSLFPSGFSSKIFSIFLISPMCATCATQLTFHYLNVIFVKSVNYDIPHLSPFCSLLFFLPLRSRYSPQHPILVPP